MTADKPDCWQDIEYLASFIDGESPRNVARRLRDFAGALEKDKREHPEIFETSSNEGFAMYAVSHLIESIVGTFERAGAEPHGK
jgi:hypothetical protein